MNHHQTQRAAKRHAAQAHRLRSAGALNSQLSTVKPRSGFTLVEMLVSVALVVIMMSMFATVFQLAAGSMGTQRGIAENDQRARSVVTVIQNDLKVRSFKNLIPFDAYAEPTGPISFADRQGYFYISENELRDDTDDVLQFTVKLDGTSNDLYYGKATALFPLSTNTPMTSFLNSNNNEPERVKVNLPLLLPSRSTRTPEAEHASTILTKSFPQGESVRFPLSDAKTRVTGHEAVRKRLKAVWEHPRARPPPTLIPHDVPDAEKRPVRTTIRNIDKSSVSGNASPLGSHRQQSLKHV